MSSTCTIRLVLAASFLLFPSCICEVSFEAWTESNDQWYPSFVLHGASGPCGWTMTKLELYQHATSTASSSWQETNQYNEEWIGEAVVDRYAWTGYGQFAVPLSFRITKSNGHIVTFPDLVTIYDLTTTWYTGHDWCSSSDIDTIATAAPTPATTAPTSPPTRQPSTPQPTSTPSTTTSTRQSSNPSAQSQPSRSQATSTPSSAPTDLSKEDDTGSPSTATNSKGTNIALILGAIGAVLICIVIAIFLFLAYQKKKIDEQYLSEEQKAAGNVSAEPHRIQSYSIQYPPSSPRGVSIQKAASLTVYDEQKEAVIGTYDEMSSGRAISSTQDPMSPRSEEQSLETGATQGTDNGCIQHSQYGEDALPVRRWLEGEVKLPQYLDSFVSNGYETLEIIKQIADENDLNEIGITLKGHQKLILFKIQTLRAKQEGNEIATSTETQAEMEGAQQTGLEEGT